MERAIKPKRVHHSASLSEFRVGHFLNYAPSASVTPILCCLVEKADNKHATLVPVMNTEKEILLNLTTNLESVFTRIEQPYTGDLSCL